ncbi:MAG: response regulator [Opitutales bacterium]|nr:response regulator [Opitutales bacterium]
MLSGRRVSDIFSRWDLALMKWLGTRFVILMFLPLGVFATDEIPYEPKIPSAFLEPWRWHRIEALEGLGVLAADQAEDSGIWLVSHEALIRYDGRNVELVYFPENLGVGLPYGVRVLDERTIMVFSSEGVYIYADQQWSIVRKSSSAMQLRFSQSVLLESGKIIFPQIDGIFEWKEGYLELITREVPHPHCLLLDPLGDLWVTTFRGGHVYLISGFEQQSIPVTSESVEQVQKIEGANQRVWTVHDAKRSEILFFNSSRSIQGMTYNYRTGRWRERHEWNSYRHNEHEGVFLSNEDSLICACDDKLLISKNGEDAFLERSDVSHPSNYKFLLSLLDGKTLFGGQRDSIFIIDTGTTNWESYEDLNFQFEDASANRWFISREGDIVKQSLESRKWSKFGCSSELLEAPQAGFLTTEGIPVFVGSDEGAAAISYFHNNEWKKLALPKLGHRIGYQAWSVRDDCFYVGGTNVYGQVNEKTGGICRLSWQAEQQSFEAQHYLPANIHSHIASLISFPDESLWVGGAEIRKIHQHDSKLLSQQFPWFWVDHMVRASDGRIWIAQMGYGLTEIRDEEWKVHSIADQDFFSRVVYLLEDQFVKGHLWAGTQKGIYRYDGESWFPEPLHRDIVLDREGGSLRQAKDGSIWANSATRSWYFRDAANVEDLHMNSSNFDTIGISTQIEAPETRFVSYESSIPEFGVAYFSWEGDCKWGEEDRENLLFSYKLNDVPWSAFTSDRSVLIPNITQRQNVMQVRARSIRGQVDPTPAVVSFEVVPVIWKRAWFWVVAGSVLLLVVALVVKIIMLREQHIVEMEEHKLQFFTHISHELRTPLTVILGPIETLLKKTRNEQEHSMLGLAAKNARKMLKLVDELLDFRKIEYGHYQPKYTNIHPITFIDGGLKALQPLALEKNQKIEFNHNLETWEGKYDAYTLEKALDNVISNAIKYTQRGGMIRIQVSVDNRRNLLRIAVEDNGPGISDQDKKTIFKPFVRARSSDTEEKKGSGIGLTLTHSLIEQSGGSITVDSPIYEKMGGARFTILMPYTVDKTGEAISVQHEPGEERDAQLQVSKQTHEWSILLVDDNEDILSFLEEYLQEQYEVTLARDGVEALKLLKEHTCDIVVSDVMMPLMGGKELCQSIKTNPDLSHIPVIMLTALKSDEHEFKALQKGADVYLTKPVNLPKLQLILENMINARKHLRSHWQQHASLAGLPNSTLEIGDANKSFLDKIIKVIEENMIEESFDVEQLATKLFMSRMTLYRKVKALLKESPGDIIRRLRMTRAAQYLDANPGVAISAVAEKVGILDMSHFSKLFKKQHGCTPTQYLQQKR